MISQIHTTLGRVFDPQSLKRVRSLQGAAAGHVALALGDVSCVPVLSVGRMVRLADCGLGELSNGPLFIERNEQDRRQGARFGSVSVSFGAGEARYPGALLPSGFRFPGNQCRRSDLLERYERQIASMDAFSPEANAMSLLVHGGGVFMKLDQEGRLMVTDFVREFTGISTEVTFVGRADHFQLWQPNAFLGAQAEARAGRGFSAARPA